ncbi:MAG: superoxide dismutase [Steroidobacteraceae bacterium]
MSSQPHFELPALGYAYDALEPAYSAEALELHYASHHQAYVDGANQALEAMAEMRGKGDFARVNQLEKDLAFHYSGHFLHSMFWRNLEPNEGAPPSGQLEARIRSVFGSTDAFRRQFGAAGASLQGSGWVALSWELTRGSLIIEQIHDHQDNGAMGALPILVMDMWEHAYYLQYKNKKERWIVGFWELINWGDVARRLDNAECADLALDPDVQRVFPGRRSEPDNVRKLRGR